MKEGPQALHMALRMSAVCKKQEAMREEVNKKWLLQSIIIPARSSLLNIASTPLSVTASHHVS
jgi:hypothetical protein